MATWMRFELTTSAVTGRHSNQLNYQAINNMLITNYFPPLFSHGIFLLRKIIPWRVLHEPDRLVLELTLCDHFMESAQSAARACFMVEVTGLEPVTPCL